MRLEEKEEVKLEMQIEFLPLLRIVGSRSFRLLRGRQYVYGLTWDRDYAKDN